MKSASSSLASPVYIPHVFSPPNTSWKVSNDLRKIEEDMEKTYKKITGNLSRSNYISNLVKYEEKGIKSLDTFNYSLPWGRINEISFDVTTGITDAHDLKIPDEVVYKLENKKRS